MVHVQGSVLYYGNIKIHNCAVRQFISFLNLLVISFPIGTCISWQAGMCWVGVVQPSRFSTSTAPSLTDPCCGQLAAWDFWLMRSGKFTCPLVRSSGTICSY